jgi:hypothetical protein
MVSGKDAAKSVSDAFLAKYNSTTSYPSDTNTSVNINNTSSILVESTPASHFPSSFSETYPFYPPFLFGALLAVVSIVVTITLFREPKAIMSMKSNSGGYEGLSTVEDLKDFDNDYDSESENDTDAWLNKQNLTLNQSRTDIRRSRNRKMNLASGNRSFFSKLQASLLGPMNARVMYPISLYVCILNLF